MSKKWKCWCAEGFIRMVDGCRRRDALETLTITRDMLPRRGRIKYDWSTDDQWRHPDALTTKESPRSQGRGLRPRMMTHTAVRARTR
jgi:hypothetical protein